MSYSIGTVAKKMEISIDTIRYYDKEGLLPFVERDESGRRKFTDNDMHLMKMIMCLKQARVPVKDIATFVGLRMHGDDSLGERLSLLQHHEGTLRAKIADMKATLAYMEFKLWYYETAVKAGTESIHYVDGTTEVDPDIEATYFKAIK